MTFPFGQTVTLLVKGEPTGRTIDGYTYSPTAIVLEGCGFNPGGSSESLGGQDLVTDQPEIYCPPGTVLPAAIDQAIVGGITYDVDGTASDWRSPFTGWNPGIVVRLVAWTG